MHPLEFKMWVNKKNPPLTSKVTSLNRKWSTLRTGRRFSHLIKCVVLVPVLLSLQSNLSRPLVIIWHFLPAVQTQTHTLTTHQWSTESRSGKSFGRTIRQKLRPKQLRWRCHRSRSIPFHHFGHFCSVICAIFQLFLIKLRQKHRSFCKIPKLRH